ncbi:MAG: RpiB/LacA/LacB family sugar-phosphate isomerase [Planctomycetes bacterium]|nr:RpiB/LacA/LacB family sugar-phosphate isomerase [Planctomycetota bacterium]
MKSKKLVIGADDAALDFKDAIVAFVKKKGYSVEDLTPGDDTVYPDVAALVAKAVIAGNGEKRGILICGTGIGMAMSANKFPGIRAAQIHDSYSAERAALSNDANIITMGARVIGIELGKKLVGEWLPLKFKPGSSSPKVAAKEAIEQRNFKKFKA